MISAAAKEPIYKLGGGFMISREAKAFSAETGLSGWAPYFRGRCGVLGEVDADVVAAAVGFFPPRVVRDHWEAARSLPAAETAARYARVAADFGRRKLAGLPDEEAERLAGLLEAVCDNAGPVAAPLFAGWRAMPRPADPRSRVIHLAHVLRELRGGLHIVAVLAAGLTPLESVLSTADNPLMQPGETNAEYFGWPRPYPEVTAEIQARRRQAEELTDTLIAPAFAALDAAGQNDLAELLTKADKVVFG
ncbi:SCO6745 family protein [Actinomadura kijaniata]|uniref:SCO6745 family protein n=1 Tax=Actinomadura kijaniata TaxID=46161 RepID=UPI003F1E44B7